ncbi:PorV/PorQ family protein [Ignavibacteria bacterium 4148-Me]|uniref:PorV/PorQ family protein n=1 Tax=Rosettibacter primus TaxID=3111523 RepID=UPI00336BB332
MRRVIIIVLLMSINITAQFNKVGRTSLQFLKIGIGARETAMGEACTANINSIQAIYWNPAALSNMNGFQASLNYVSWFADLDIKSAAIGFNLGNFGVIALGYSILDYGNIEEAKVISPSGGMDTRTGNYFSGKDLSFIFSYARAFTDKLSIGINVKYLREDLFTYSSKLWAFDIGSYYNTGWKGIRLAMSAQNFANQARWLNVGSQQQQTYEIPLLYRIAVSIDLLGGENLFLGGNPDYHRLTVNVDAIHSNDYSERLNIGGEYVFLNKFFIRGGYKFNVDEGNIALGVGVKTDIYKYSIQLDYSYVHHIYLESPHRFSIMLSF